MLSKITLTSNQPKTKYKQNKKKSILVPNRAVTSLIQIESIRIRMMIALLGYFWLIVFKLNLTFYLK